MYYIGYILGIVLILWLIITLVKALSGKKDKGSDAGPSSADYPSAGGSAGSEGSGIRTAVPEKDLKAEACLREKCRPDRCRPQVLQATARKRMRGGKQKDWQKDPRQNRPGSLRKSI